MERHTVGKRKRGTEELQETQVCMCFGPRDSLEYKLDFLTEYLLIQPKLRK